jgi:AraC-like DNA-binding protein
MRLEKSAPKTPASFNPSAINLAGPGFSLIEMHNAPAVGSWKPNPDATDLRLAYFRKAPGLTLALNGDPEPVSPGSVRFIDTSLGGSFDAPEGFHALQLNIDRSSLKVGDAELRSLLRVPDLAKHPIVGTFVIPALVSWKRPGIDREASGSADILRSLMATLVGSLLETPVDDEAQKPALSRAIKKYLDASYDNPDLDTMAIAERFNLSRRSLFYLFEPEELRLGERIRALRTRKALELLRNCDVEWIHQCAKHAPCGERVYRDECQGDPSIRDRCPYGAATTTGVAEPQHLTELAELLSSRRRSIPASIFSNWGLVAMMLWVHDRCDTRRQGAAGRGPDDEGHTWSGARKGTRG